jgi:L-ribulose-5-phosphate 4-epimerase
MQFESLRTRVHYANQELAGSGLVMGTFGNLSAVDRDAGVMVIKPSGVPYEQLAPEHMVPVSLETGEVIDATLRPSSDTPTHLELYRAFPCGAVVHTHSECATTLAQARLGVRCLGTTHADYFRGDVPVTRPMRQNEVEVDYERHTGLVIIETFAELNLSPEDVQAVLVANHGPFAWGPDTAKAIETARVLEYLSRIECRLLAMDVDVARPDAFLVDKHYRRKHGATRYYGQK